LFIGNSAAGWSCDALHIDVPDEGAVGVTIEDTDDLIHPRSSAAIYRLEFWPRKRLVHISGDRTRFIQAESGMFKGRDFAERMSCHVRRRWAPQPEDIDRRKPVLDVLFVQCEANRTYVDAVRLTKEDRRRV
jgi:hypothetical protein